MGDLVQLEIDFDPRFGEDFEDESPGPGFGQLFANTPVIAGHTTYGDQLKEEGMQKALRKEAAQHYRDEMIKALKKFPLKTVITVERLTEIVGRPPKGVSSAVIGAAVNTMAKRGLIRQTGHWVKPERKERHSSKVPEWEVLKHA